MTPHAQGMDAETRSAHVAPARHVATGEGVPVGWMRQDIDRTERGRWWPPDNDIWLEPDPATYTASALALGTPILPEEAKVGDLFCSAGKWMSWGITHHDDPHWRTYFPWLRPHPVPEPVPAPTVEPVCTCGCHRSDAKMMHFRACCGPGTGKRTPVLTVDAAHPPEGYRLAVPEVDTIPAEHLRWGMNTNKWMPGMNPSRFIGKKFQAGMVPFAIPLEPAPTVDAGPVEIRVPSAYYTALDQIVHGEDPLRDQPKRYAQMLIRTDEEAIRAKLIELGWTPPAPPAAAPDPRDAIEALIHALAMAAWDEGADAGVVWCPDADMTKRGVVPMSQEEGLKRSREHFAEHGAGSPAAPFGIALHNLRAALSKLEPKS